MAVDGRALHGIDRDRGAGAPGGRRLRAGLSLSLHIRCRREALGLQGSMQLGRCPQALARAPARRAGHRGRTARRGLGSTVDVSALERRRPGGAASLGAFGLMGYTRVHAEVHEYDVFARKTRVEPLHQVGSVVAPDDDLAMAYARATYDEERWVEMMIVPKAAIISLWAPGGDS